MTNIKRPGIVKVENPTFPYIIVDANKPASSYYEVSRVDVFDDSETTLFYIAGGELDVRDRGQAGKEHSLELTHSFARDEEGDQAHVAMFTLKSLQMISAYDHKITFSAWLTEAQFYPQDYVDPNFPEFDPFLGAKDKKSREKNSGFPYLPPKVKFSGENAITFPIEVQISLRHNRVDAHSDMIKEEKYHDKARADRAAKAESARLERERKDAERAEAHAQWLLTDEGRAEVAERKLLDRIKEDVPKDKEFSSEELSEKVAAAVESFTDEELEFIQASFETRRGWDKLSTPSRQLYVDMFQDAVMEPVTEA